MFTNQFVGNFKIRFAIIGKNSKIMEISNVNDISLKSIHNDYRDFEGNIVHRQVTSNNIKISCDCEYEEMDKIKEFIGKDMWMQIESDDELPPMRGFINTINFEPYFDYGDQTLYKANINFIGGFDYIKEQGEIAHIKEAIGKNTNKRKRTIKRQVKREIEKKEKKRKITFI